MAKRYCYLNTTLNDVRFSPYIIEIPKSLDRAYYKEAGAEGNLRRAGFLKTKHFISVIVEDFEIRVSGYNHKTNQPIYQVFKNGIEVPKIEEKEIDKLEGDSIEEKEIGENKNANE